MKAGRPPQVVAASGDYSSGRRHRRRRWFLPVPVLRPDASLPSLSFSMAGDGVTTVPPLAAVVVNLNNRTAPLSLDLR
ncbi:hypothetical protein HanRHA438_Chr10g0469201 [Helianthus annuus]|nr:hypothetical protein HanRHA438_Chr10g0469201 [Helianthus annuus]